MSHTRKPMALVIGAAVAAGSLFTMDAMANGYMHDSGKTSAAEGKCGEGKCGEGQCGGKTADSAKAGHEGGCGVAKMDTDKDGRVSRAEFAAAHAGKEDKFADHDSDGDGFITQAEIDARRATKKGAKSDDKAAAKTDGEMKCGEGKCGGKP